MQTQTERHTETGRQICRATQTIGRQTRQENQECTYVGRQAGRQMSILVKILFNLYTARYNDLITDRMTSLIGQYFLADCSIKGNLTTLDRLSIFLA